MKSISAKILIIFLIISILPVCAGAARKQTSAREQRIARAYAADRAELYHLAESYARRFTLDERLLWLEFIKQEPSPYADTYSLYQPLIRLNTLKGHERRLRGAMMENYSLRSFAKMLLNRKAYRILNKVADSRVRDVRLRRRALELLAIMDQLHARAEEIKAHRDAQLIKLENIDRVIIEAPAPEPVHLPAPQLGLVSAISYGGDNSICMVEGVDQILTTGDTIYTDQAGGVKVIRIGRNSVEFKKNKRTWTQALGEPPNSAWTK